MFGPLPSEDGHGPALGLPRGRTGRLGAGGTSVAQIEWPPPPFLYRPAAMRIGVAREIKQREYRVALTPAGALELVQHGHEVTIEQDAGVGSGFVDDAYAAVGARIAPVDEVWASAELLLKVKEPIAEEYGRLREDLALFTYLHIAADEPLTNALLASGITGIAYET